MDNPVLRNALISGLLSGGAGYMFTDNPENKLKNAMMAGLFGAGAGGGLTYLSQGSAAPGQVPVSDAGLAYLSSRLDKIDESIEMASAEGKVDLASRLMELRHAASGQILAQQQNAEPNVQPNAQPNAQPNVPPNVQPNAPQSTSNTPSISEVLNSGIDNIDTDMLAIAQNQKLKSSSAGDLYSKLRGVTFEDPDQGWFESLWAGGRSPLAGKDPSFLSWKMPANYMVAPAAGYLTGSKLRDIQIRGGHVPPQHPFYKNWKSGIAGAITASLIANAVNPIGLDDASQFVDQGRFNQAANVKANLNRLVSPIKDVRGQLQSK
jgi:hypothetical protein